MSGIAGIVTWSGPRPDEELVKAMAAAMAHRARDGTTVRSSGRGVFAHLHHATTPWSVHEDQPILNSAGSMLTCDVRLDQRPWAGGVAGINVPDGCIVDRVLQQQGLAGIASLRGDFAIARCEADGVLHLARDFLGVRPLYYALVPEGVAFASEPAGLLAIPTLERKPDLDWILDWRTGMWGCPTNTFVASIRQVPPGTVLRIDSSGEMPNRYWDPFQIPVDAGMTEQQAVAGYRAHFEQAVRTRLPALGVVGSQLSGGLDSSGVTALAARHHRGPEPLRTYSMVFDETPECDERSYIEPFLQQYGDLDARYVVSDDHGPWWRMEERVEWLGGPQKSLHASFLMALICRAGEEGVSVLLNGSEGDLTTGSSYYYGVDLLRQGRFRQLSRFLALPETEGMGARARRVFRKGVFPAVQGAAIPLMRMVLGGYETRRQEYSMGGPVPPLLLHRYRERVDRFFPLSRRSIRSDAQGHRLQFNPGLVGELLRMADHVHARAGVEARYPFFDQDLVEFSLRVPATHRVQPPFTRHVYRAALTDVLPLSIHNRTTKTSFRQALIHSFSKDGPISVPKTETNVSFYYNMFNLNNTGEPLVVLRRHMLARAWRRVLRTP